jgi:hypothetical protein
MQTRGHPLNRALAWGVLRANMRNISVRSEVMHANHEVAEARVRPGDGRRNGEAICIDVPEGHIGPVLLSETGRTVWWTGRVAIGLRYEAPDRSEPYGQSALWIQNVLLGGARARA